jgi:hypothetical protein
MGQQAAQRRADHEAGPEGRAQQAHAAGALLGRGDVGHVALDRRDVAAAEAADQADGHGDPDVRREGQGQVGDGVGDDGDDQHRPPADAVRHPPPERLAEELAQAVGGEHGRHLPRGGVHRLGVEGQQRDDHAEAHQVDEDNQEQDGQGAGTVGGFGHQGAGFTPEPSAWRPALGRLGVSPAGCSSRRRRRSR